MNTADSATRFRWGFGNGLLALLALCVMGELVVMAASWARGPGWVLRWAGGGLLFLVGLALLRLLFFRWQRVHDFFRSIHIGVLSLVLLGCASIAGVLFHQEDPLFPIPVADGSSRTEQMREQHYLDFRHAQAYFVYHLIHPFGLGEEPVSVPDDMASAFPELGGRYGEEFGIGLETGTFAALKHRGRKARIEALEVDWDPFWRDLWAFCDRFDILRVYKSDWFAVLWGVLFFSILSNGLRFGVRQLARPKRWGFALSHLGMLLIIGGGLASRVQEVRGVLNMHVGDAFPQFDGYDGTRYWLGEPPFTVRLDAFRADYHDVLEVHYLVEDAQGQLSNEFQLATLPSARLYTGQQLAYDFDDAGVPRLEIEVMEVSDQAHVEQGLVPSPTGEPLVQLALEHQHGAIPFLLDTQLSPPLDAPGMDWRLRYASVADLAAARRLLTKPLPAHFGKLRIRVDDGVEQAIEFEPGTEFTLVGRAGEYRFRVERATPAFFLQEDDEGQLVEVQDGRTAASTAPDNPAVRVRIEAPDGTTEQRWAFDLFDAEAHGMQSEIQAISLELEWDYWTAPAHDRWLLFHLADGSLHCGNVGEVDSLTPVSEGDRLPLPGDSLLRLVAASLSAEPAMQIEPIETDFFDTTPGAVRLRIATPSGERITTLSTERGSNVELLSPYRVGEEERLVGIRFQENRQELPKEWRSRVTILETDASDRLYAAAVGEIRVNDYLEHKGYRFFQTNARAEDPTYSGIGVVYDPGIEPVLAGLYMVMAGTFVAFFLKPLLTRRIQS